MSGQQSWSIIVFAYNEKGNVERVVQKAIDILPKLSDTFEIVIVDDGSTDGSESYFQKISTQHVFIRHIRIYQNKGIGHALRMGYANAQMENICAVPGDGQFDLEELLPFKRIDQNKIIAFYRETKNYNAFRSFLTQFNAWLNRRLMGLNVKDVNWIKIYKYDQIRSVPIKLDSSLLESELCAKLNARGFEPVEIPSIYHTRDHGEPKGASWKTVTQALKELPFLLKEIRKFRHSPKN